LGRTAVEKVEGYDLNNVQYDGRTRSNSNVLLSAWGSFVISLLLVTSWWQSSTTVRDWVLLAAVSIAMMISSYYAYSVDVSVEQEDGSYTANRLCTMLKNYSCNRILLGQYLGLASGVVSLIMIPMTRVPLMVHVIVSALVFIGWVVGVSMIAYGSGHGTSAGDVFIEVWAGVFLSLDILSNNIAILMRTRKHGDDRSDPADNQSETPTSTLLSLANQEQNVEQHANQSKDPIDTLDLMPEITEVPEATNI
jgi:hypothetical protein